MSITQDTTEISTSIPGGTWGLDPVHSDVGFAVTYSGAGTFRGTFDTIDASLVDGKLEGSTAVSTIRVDDPNLQGHLQSPDFFDAEQHPTLSFSADSIERDGDAVTIEGELTLRGETKPVTLTGSVVGPTPDAYGNQRVAFDVATTIDRREFGIELEPRAADRPARARQRRQADREPRARPGAGVTMRIVALSGSLRAGSHNTLLLQAAAAGAPDGIELELYEGLKEIPPYDADDDLPGAQPEPVERLRAALAAADAVLVATPEYNSSIPGALKNALDWVSRPLADSPVRNKPVAVLSSSTGMFGGVWAAAETRKVLGALGARTLEETVSVPKAHERLADGVDAELLAEIRGVVGALAAAVAARTEGLQAA